MKSLFVTAEDDIRGNEALGYLREAGFETLVIDPITTEAPHNSIAIFSIRDGYARDEELKFPGTSSKHHLRLASYRLTNCPWWAYPTLFRIAVRRQMDYKMVHPNGRFSPTEAVLIRTEGLKNAVVAAAQAYTKWDGDHSSTPWGGAVPKEKNKKIRYDTWLTLAMRNAVDFESLSTALLRNPQVRPQAPIQPLPTATSAVYSMMCPNFKEHGVLGGPDSLDFSKVDATAQIYKRLANESGGTFQEMTVFLPDSGLHADPWRKILPPGMWDDLDLETNLKMGQEALCAVLNRIAEVSGLIIHTIPLSTLSADKLLEMTTIDAMDDMIEQLLPLYTDFQSDYSGYNPKELAEKIRLEHALYLLVADSLPQGATVINMEVWRESWNVAWKWVQERNPMSLWWPTKRQHFNTTNRYAA